MLSLSSTSYNEEQLSDFIALLDEIICLTDREPYELSQLDNVFSQFKSKLLSLDNNTLQAFFQHHAVSARLPSIHYARALYEYHQELAQAKELLEQPDCQAIIKNFSATHFPQTAIHSPEFLNYINGKQHTLVIGCGALPSTTMLLGDNTPLQLSAMDRCETSLAYAKSVLEHWNKRSVNMVHSDVATLTDRDRWDVVFVNALVGVDQECSGKEKTHIVKTILDQTSAKTLLVFRVPEGVNSYLYPAIDSHLFDTYQTHYIAPPVAGRSGLLLLIRE